MKLYLPVPDHNESVEFKGANLIKYSNKGCSSLRNYSCQFKLHSKTKQLQNMLLILAKIYINCHKRMLSIDHSCQTWDLNQDLGNF